MRREFENWLPLPDRDKPRMPYKTGAIFNIRRHQPPLPYGPGYRGIRKPPRPIVEKSVLKNLTQTQACLTYPVLDPTHSDRQSAIHYTPLPSQMGHKNGPNGTHTMEIIGHIDCREGRGAQVVMCHIDGGKQHVLAAKIYDALYYSYFDDWGPVDVTWGADRDYSKETAAYERLHPAGLEGVPRYYGSWTFEVAVPNHPGVVRNVRMVLMEYVEGISMLPLLETGEHRLFSDAERLRIMARLMELQARMAAIGLGTIDMAPRNVVLTDPKSEAWLGRGEMAVFIVDFGTASIYDAGEPGLLPRSPLAWYPRHCPAEFESWMPEEMASGYENEAYQEWARGLWEGSNEFRPPSPPPEMPES